MKRRCLRPLIGLTVILMGISLPAGAAAPVPWSGTVDGVTRTALVYPGREAATTPSPLVFFFHGLGGVVTADRDWVRLSAAWPEATIVFPQGLARRNRGLGGSAPRWQADPGEFDDGDVKFVEALLQDLSTTYKVDERRVYAAGFSNGANFCYVLLTVAPQNFAAFAPVSVIPSPGLKWARVPRPVMIVNGSLERGDFDPVLARWACSQVRLLNGCSAEASEWGTPLPIGGPGSVSYSSCAADRPVVLTLHNGGHEWPEGLSENIVRFFKEHPLPAAPEPPAPWRPDALDTSAAHVGTGRAGYSGEGGPAAAAQLNFPEAVALDPAGNLFIADTGNCRIRKVGNDGLITRVAGTGEFHPNRSSRALTNPVFYPLGVALDREGSLFIADTYNRLVRKVTPAGLIRTILDAGTLSVPTGLGVDREGSLFIADSESHRVLKVTRDGTVSTIAGTGEAGFSGDGQAAVAAQLNAPWGLAIDREGSLFIADSANNRVRKVTPDGIITTVAGRGIPGFAGDGGAATSAALHHPAGLTVDSEGALFIVDRRNHRVRKVAANGVISTVFGAGESDGGGGSEAPGYFPADVAVDEAGHLLIADPFNARIWKTSGLAAPGLVAGLLFSEAGP